MQAFRKVSAGNAKRSHFNRMRTENTDGKVDDLGEALRCPICQTEPQSPAAYQINIKTTCTCHRHVRADIKSKLETHLFDMEPINKLPLQLSRPGEALHETPAWAQTRANRGAQRLSLFRWSLPCSAGSTHRVHGTHFWNHAFLELCAEPASSTYKGKCLNFITACSGLCQTIAYF